MVFILSCTSATMPLSAQSGAGAARVIVVQGRVEVGVPDWVPAQLNQMLAEGNSIRTYQQSRAAVLLSDETQLKLNANTELQIRSSNRSSSLISRIAASGARSEQSILNVGAGQVYVRAKKTPARVQVNTPAVTAAIRGTEFDILVRPDGETVTTVLEGSVDYRNEFGAIIVNSGEQGTARPGQAPTKTVILNPEDAVQWTLFYTAAASARDYPFLMGPAAAAAALRSPVADPVRKAMLLHDAGQLDEALTAVQDGRSPEADLVRGWIFLEQNRIPDAVAAFERAGNLSRAKLGLAMAYSRAGEFDRALTYVEGADTDELRLQAATLALLSGDVPAAMQELNAVAEGGSSGGLRQSLLATVYLTQNRKDDALKAAEEAVRLNPDSPSTHVTLSRVQQAFFDLPEARKAAERAFALDPDFIDARIQLARLLFGEGLTSRAETIIDGALALAPEEAGANSLMGFIALARGHSDEAESFFAKAIARDSSLADPRLGLGILKMRRNEHFDAAAEFLAATTLEPRLSLYQSYLAKAFYELKQFDQAFTSVDTAVKLDPRDPTPHFYSGVFLDDLNRPGEAVRAFEQSIRLNDNRAVYRSRFLLDQDRAARNVNLAKSFSRLGLSEWGNSEAVLSELDDPANSSAHLFLANTFLNLPGRTLAAGSELLLTRLLAPVNANSFNTFNDYTTLFDLPRVYWGVGGTYGSYDSFGGDVVSTGGNSRIAFNLAFDYSREGGFREVNDEARRYTSVNFVKIALSPESDLLLSYSNQQSNEGDVGSQVLVNELNDPNRTSFVRTQRAEIGYHRRLRPGSEVIAVVSGRSVDQVIDDPDTFNRYGIDFGLRRSVLSPDLDVQLAHLLDLGRVSVRYGLDVFEGRSSTWDVLRFQFPGSDELTTQEFDAQYEKIRYKTAFVRTDYKFTRKLLGSAGVNWDWSNDDNRYDTAQKSESRWNPQVGLMYSPFDNTRFRAAYFQNLQTHFQERVVPAHLMGFLLGQNEASLSHSRAYNAGWDQRFGSRSFFRSFAFWRDREIPTLNFEDLPADFRGKFYGGRLVLSQFLTDRFTLVGDYALNHSLDTSSVRHDHEFELALRWVHPLGIFLTAKENFLRQTGQLGEYRTATKVPTTDLEAAYEFPDKIGLATFEVQNLFDRKYEFLVDPLALQPRVPARVWAVRLRFFF